MKKLALENLGIEFMTGDNFYYRGIQVVPNLLRYYKTLQARYNLQGNQSFDPSVVGRAVMIYEIRYENFREALREGANVDGLIIIKSGFSRSQEAFIKGHEETHLALNFGQLDLVKLALARTRIGFGGLEREHEEVICNLGGIVAVKRAILKSNRIKPYIPYLPDDIYIQAMRRWLEEKSYLKVKPE